MNIKEAIQTLDPTNEDNFTLDGLPRVDTIGELVGFQVTREQITDAFPDYNRETAPPPEEPTAKVALAEGQTVLDLDPQIVCRDPAMTEQALRMIEKQVLDCTREKQAIDAKLAHMHRYVDLLTRLNTSHEAAGKNRNTAAVQAYLETTQITRHQKADSAAKFVLAGTNIKDVTAQLQGASKLDQALGARGRDPSNKRRVVPLNVPVEH